MAMLNTNGEFDNVMNAHCLSNNEIHKMAQK